MPVPDLNIDTHSLTDHFDYIIAGAGCAGLSLLYSMMMHPFFKDKQILLIDQSVKNNNDRTWCFWEEKPGVFEEIVHHRWKQIDFYSNYFSGRFDIIPYEYKMIRSIDFYAHILTKAKQKDNIHFLYGHIQSGFSKINKAVVYVDGKEFSADYVFNSIFFKEANEMLPSKKEKKIYSLLQHFKGRVIETSKNVFDDRIATFMDFRISQHQGTSFVYVLPIAPNKALIEYTIFSEQLLEPEQYNEAIKNYIADFIKPGTFSITEEEFGVIPMTNFPFSKGEGNIVNIGTAGGHTKPSSGFTFRFIQKHTAKIINALVTGKDPHIQETFRHRRFNLYDSVLLHILQKKKMGGDKIFADLFKKNPPQRILRFLDNETNASEELKIMKSVSSGIFLPVVIKELMR